MKKLAILKSRVLCVLALALSAFQGPIAHGQSMPSISVRQGSELSPTGNCSFTYCWTPLPSTPTRGFTPLLPSQMTQDVPQVRTPLQSPPINPTDVEMSRLLGRNAFDPMNNNVPNLDPTPGVKLSEYYPLADNTSLFTAGTDSFVVFDKYGHPWFILDGKAKTVAPGYVPQPGETVNTDENAGLVTGNPLTGQVLGIESGTSAKFARDTDGGLVIELVKGAMRAVTGWLKPSRSARVSMNGVAYSIGIRGTDYKVSADKERVCALVLDGAITMAVGTPLAFDVNKGGAACASPMSNWTFQTVDLKEIPHLTRHTRVDAMVERTVKVLTVKAAMVGRQQLVENSPGVRSAPISSH